MRLATVWMIRGALALLFGILALVWPGATVVALAVLFGAYAIVDGVWMLVGAFDRHGGPGHRLWHVFTAVLGIVGGAAVLLWPQLTALVLAVVIGAWAIATGAGEVWTAWKLRDRLSHPWLPIAVGGLSVLAGIVLVLWPGPGAIAIATIVGAYAIVAGVVLLIAGWRLHRAGTVKPDFPMPAAR